MINYNSRWADYSYFNKEFETIYKKIEELTSPELSYWIKPVYDKSQLEDDAKDGTVCLVMNEFQMYIKNKGWKSFNEVLEQASEEDIDNIFKKI